MLAAASHWVNSLLNFITGINELYTIFLNVNVV